MHIGNCLLVWDLAEIMQASKCRCYWLPLLPAATIFVALFSFLLTDPHKEMILFNSGCEWEKGRVISWRRMLLKNVYKPKRKSGRGYVKHRRNWNIQNNQLIFGWMRTIKCMQLERNAWIMQSRTVDQEDSHTLSCPLLAASQCEIKECWKDGEKVCIVTVSGWDLVNNPAYSA